MSGWPDLPEARAHMINFAEFHFIRPYWLLAMLPVLAITLLILRSKLSQGLWSSVCDAELLPYLLQEKSATHRRGLLSVGVLAAILVVIALAGPSWERLPAPVFRNASALVIVLDLSRSMDAEDVKPSRLVRARYKITDMLKQRKDGQTALLVYAGDAFTVTPLTDDTETIANQLSALNTGIMPSQGSDTALALEKAGELFKQAGLQKGHIILVTDGIDDNAIAAAKALDTIQVSVLGVGTADGAPIALADGGFLKDRQGAIVVPKLNPEALMQLAQAGHGHYQTLTANDADIQTLMANVNRPVQQQGKEQADVLLEQWEDRGPWLLLLVLPLAALMFRKGVLCLALVLLPLPKNSYALDWQDLWQTKDQQAQQAYNSQQYGKAADLFERPDWKAAAHYQAGDYAKALEHKPAQSSDGFYNQGNALAQSGQLEQALKAYDQALALNPGNTDAQANKEMVKKALEQQKQQKQDDQKNNGKPSGEQKPDQQGDQKSDPNQEDQASESSENDQKPEQKPERPGKEQPSSDTKQQNTNLQQKKQDADNQQTERAEQDRADEQDLKKNSGAQQPETPLSDEKQQANEQWLKRIPDDPSGLLKRKFKYQYGQRGHEPPNGGQAW
ncbi:MAG: VWA domain-containing protein [Methylovulum sp.]|nr:VWA domain-containing protein [Methylovulum sp.]